MKNMKKLALFAAGLLMPALSQAAQPQGVKAGIGGSLRSDDALIYLPIEVGPVFRVEPFFGWSKMDLTVGGASTSSESRVLGAGGFFRLDLHERIQTYFGGRLAYVEVDNGGGDLDGFDIEPTVGAEFYVTERVSVALEAFLYYQNIDGSNGGGAAVEQENTGSDTRLLVRFFPF